MSKIDDKDELARLRIGFLMGEDVLQQELSAAGINGEFEGYCVSAWIPAPLLSSMGRVGAAMQQQMDMLDPPGAAERLLLLVVQFDDVQLRFVMPLSEPVVRQYLRDCTQRGRIRLLLANEATKEHTFTDLPGGFRDPELASRILQEAEGLAGDPQTLLRFGELICPLGGLRSLIPGRTVADAVTVLVSNREFELIAKTGAGVLSRKRSSLH